ncbi:MAG: GDP-L-fucose synthase [Alphaproteobacteria bacterium]|jgi:GDP-L-fucose synthase|nr:GDP-L-fucose synthase [Alphaproteobacteria bacterium]
MELKPSDSIYIAGHTGLIGSGMQRCLAKNGYTNIITATHKELELTDAVAVRQFILSKKPDYIVLAAGRVGGIVDNKTYPVDFITTNLAIQLNILQAAHEADVKKLVLYASSCMYPRECPQPMAESALLTGVPEPTSMAYAMSKLAGMQMCLAYNQQYGRKKFIPVIPNSAFGPNDNFNPQAGHVLSVLLRRFHEAKTTKVPSITLWGSGSPRREFVYVDDIADATLSLLTRNIDDVELPLNLGLGIDYSIKELAEKIARVTGYQGVIEWDTSKPDGAPQKLLDSSRLRAFGWTPKIDFDTGLKETYDWFLQNIAQAGEAT